MVATTKKIAGGRDAGDYYLGKSAQEDNYYIGDGEEALTFFSLHDAFVRTGDRVTNGMFRDMLEGYAPDYLYTEGADRYASARFADNSMPAVEPRGSMADIFMSAQRNSEDLDDKKSWRAVRQNSGREIQGDDTDPVGAIDLTLSMDKSQSALWAAVEMSDDEDLKAAMGEAHKRAYQATLEQLKATGALICTRMGEDGELRHFEADDFVAAAAMHSTSREGDPQRHTHVVIQNAGYWWDQKKATWRTNALDAKEIVLRKKAIGAIYRAAVAAEVGQIQGFENITSVDANGYTRINAIPDEVIEMWSKREERAKVVARERGQIWEEMTGAQRDALIQELRPKKRAYEETESCEHWRSELEEIGLSPDALIKRVREAARVAALSDDQIFDQALERLDDEAVYQDYKVLAKLAEAAQGQRSPTAIIDLAEKFKRERLLSLGFDDENRPVFTTQEQLDREIRILGIAKAGLFCREWIPDLDAVVDKKMADFERRNGFRMSEEQEGAVKKALEGNRISVIQGFAGAGKTTAARGFCEAFQENGNRVLGAAPSWKAAGVLGGETGVEATAIQGFVLDLESGKRQLDENDVIVLDEGGMVDSITMSTLVNAVEAANAKLVIMGDTQQLSAVDKGSPLQTIVSRVPECATEITEVRRQNEAWQRQASELMNAVDATERQLDENGKASRPSKISEALVAYDERGFVRVTQDREDAYKKIRGECLDALSRDRDHVALTIKNVDVVELNKDLRRIYREQGRITGEDVTVNVVTRGGEKRKNETEELRIAVGDRLMMGETLSLRVISGSGEGGEHQIRRSELVTIREIENTGNGPTLTLSVGQDQNGNEILVKGGWGEFIGRRDGATADRPEAPFLQHGYAMTVASSQGMTVDGDVSVLAAGGFTANTTLVAGTRHRDNVHWTVSGDVYRERIYKSRTQQDLRCATEKEAYEAFEREANADGRKVNAIDYQPSNDVNLNVDIEARRAVRERDRKAREIDSRSAVDPKQTSDDKTIESSKDIDCGGWQKHWRPPEKTYELEIQ